MKKIFSAAVLLWALASCSKSDVQAPPAPPAVAQKPSGPNAGNFSSDRVHNLNIVYFVPSDVDTIKGYIQRLSALLLYDRNWFKSEMLRNGYGDKTFGLLADPSTQLIKIITIYDRNPKSMFPSSGSESGRNMVLEINSYFKDHPLDKTSECTLVITPAYTYDASGEPDGPPFYGLGRWAFALDYPDFNIQYLGQKNMLGKRLTKWFGGMTHELGHGLGLAHNYSKMSEVNPLGITLMGAGNNTFGQSPTFLSAADCAVLNVNQVFNTDAKTYYGPVKAFITSINASYNATKGAIVLSGKFNADVPVTDVTYFNDPNVNNEGTGANTDYNAIAWESKPIGTDSFYVEMKISDLEHKEDSIPYELKVKLIHQNGNITETIYTYTFKNGVPVMNFSTVNEISKQGWSVKSFSSQETAADNGAAINVIDNNPATYWHSRWSNDPAPFPDTITVDMGQTQKVNGFTFLQRQSLIRSIKDLEIQYSTDGNNFSSAGNFVAANNTGTQNFSFAAPLTFRYFRVIVKSAYDGNMYACFAEIGMF
ncbi:F5/8 type C domain-containing protein [Hydrobacter penzbergensis]|uniref:F5/8 type C domain-containing protein n=1 Tax=Hydrobacter penzbergensis TaxID=1235997 RepID=A0A8X8IEH0_9BACT|nr:discoidin domain-containing protein [Hydrobacter penzbergensis]SDW40027.1 F5/8 type C domain-containing protein [Hydrobacter penzbergensis]